MDITAPLKNLINKMGVRVSNKTSTISAGLHVASDFTGRACGENCEHKGVAE
jgi:hypothetical protein